MELTIASFLIVTAGPEELFSFLVSTIVKALRVVPWKKMLLSMKVKKRTCVSQAKACTHVSPGTYDDPLSCAPLALWMEPYTLHESIAFKTVQLLSRFDVPQFAGLIICS